VTVTAAEQPITTILFSANRTTATMAAAMQKLIGKNQPWAVCQQACLRSHAHGHHHPCPCAVMPMACQLLALLNCGAMTHLFNREGGTQQFVCLV
jgi:hypothetical protein